MSDVAYTILGESNFHEQLTVQEFKTLLEKGRDEEKIDTMKKVLITMLNGNLMPSLLMHIIRFVMPSKNKELKKLLYFYWEICPKYEENGKLRQEMILVCNAIQHDLAHPNEYIRGNTLRFVTKLKEPELIEPLIPPIRQCLEHRHAYVRKNAAFAIYSIFKVSDHLLPDAAEVLGNFLAVETDTTCKRNAFSCLGQLNREMALGYLQEQLADLVSLDSLLQLAFIEFIRKDSIVAPELREQYLSIVSELLDSPSSAVGYEAAITLTVLTNSQIEVASAASKFIDLAIKEANTTVKTIALERLRELYLRNIGILDDYVLDVLRILTTSDLGVRKKALDLSLDITSSGNVDDVVKFLKKELTKSISSNEDKSLEYRQLLITAIHKCALNFNSVAADVVDLLLGFIEQLNSSAASEVVSFAKEVVEKFPALRSKIINRLLHALENVKSGKVYRGSLWILSEYAQEEKDIQDVWRHIRNKIGELPILSSEKRLQNKEAAVSNEIDENGYTNGSSKPIILPDGSYATENAFTAELEKHDDDKTGEQRPTLRALILDGDFYLAAVLSSTLLKLILSFQKISSNIKILNAMKAEAMLIMVSILRVGETSFSKKKIDEDSQERIFSIVRFLAENKTDDDFIQHAFLDDTKAAFRNLLIEADKKKAQKDKSKLQQAAQQPYDSISFRQFSKEVDTEEYSLEEQLAASTKDDLSSKLKKIVQLTGFSDSVYAEAYVKVHQFDVVLDVLLVNQTTETLRNLTVEFAALGDLKVIDKPGTQNVGPHGFLRIQATIKVTSADTGVIFGNIIYDGEKANDSNIVILNDINVDIMDYIKPATCSEAQFRKMWNEFEWENKIIVKSNVATLKEYLDVLLKGTNMNCLTPGAIIGEECQFLSANLYSHSSFGEDALANLCIEKQADGPIIGHVRIRSKGQGLALSMGDRVAAIARQSNTATISVV
ncbi:BA75_04511T0 [Komagataella pastoris]|uniref:Coatomer subunit beta n=1 Tax=Komagataella pastoris TaxID=4922 RepID=A0A1B2JJC8_PICPA|nr:BA75_04511T0 [Komagataella pastoris]